MDNTQNCDSYILHLLIYADALMCNGVSFLSKRLYQKTSAETILRIRNEIYERKRQRGCV
jgi:hypothetical protein